MFSKNSFFIMFVSFTVLFISWVTFQTIFSKGLIKERSVNNDLKYYQNIFSILESSEFKSTFNFSLEKLLVVRDVFSPGHFQVQEFLRSEIKSLKWELEEDKFEAKTPFGSVNMTNLIATSPNFSSFSKNLVLACHYDSKYFEKIKFVGATDSAVPCAMILSLARLINKQLEKNFKPLMGVKLIFFDGEEALVKWGPSDSIYGARHLAEVMTSKKQEVNGTFLNQLQLIDLFVLLDLIGTSTTSFLHTQPSSASHFNTLSGINTNLTSAKLISNNNNNINYFNSNYYNYYIEDDHIPFLNKGVPVLHLISIPFPNEWHKEGDNSSCLDHPTIHNLLKIFSIFTLDHLGLNL